MLYNKIAVKHRKNVSSAQKRLAQKYHPFKIEKSTLKECRKFTDSPDGGLLRIINYAHGIKQRVYYDGVHRFAGTRNAQQVWEDKKGHCIEQNILLYALLSHYGVKTDWIIVKNPEGYEADNLDEVGLHSFLIYREKGDVFWIDAVGAKKGREIPVHDIIFSPQQQFCIAQQPLHFHEFVAFYFGDAADDMMCHGHHKKALDLLQTALKIDPHNYIFYILQGEAHSFLSQFHMAEASYQKAKEMTPGLLDSWKVYGDFCLEAYSVEKAVKAYQAALGRRTQDIQILHDLEKRLHRIDEKKLALRANKMKHNLARAQPFRHFANYFDFHEVL